MNEWMNKRMNPPIILPRLCAENAKKKKKWLEKKATKREFNKNPIWQVGGHS